MPQPFYIDSSNQPKLKDCKNSRPWASAPAHRAPQSHAQQSLAAGGETGNNQIHLAECAGVKGWPCLKLT